jgi:hypothetical protein
VLATQRRERPRGVHPEVERVIAEHQMAQRRQRRVVVADAAAAAAAAARLLRAVLYKRMSGWS